MQRQTPINKNIVESRMKTSLGQYIEACIQLLEGMSDKGLLQGMGELIDNKMKRFVRVELRSEVIRLLKFYKDYPIFQN
jgi:hypothetical protein